MRQILFDDTPRATADTAPETGEASASARAGRQIGSSSRYSVRFRLALSNILVVLSGVVGVVGGVEISRGAKLHELNFLHVKYNHMLSDELDIFSVQGARDADRLVSMLEKIREQPVACLDVVGPMQRLAMHAFRTDRAIDLCWQDLALADETLRSVGDYRAGTIARAELVRVLDRAVVGFGANSSAFEPLVKRTVECILMVMIAVLLGKALLVAVMTYGLNQSIARDYRRLELSEASRKDQVAYFRTITDTAGDPIILIDDNGRIDFANPAASAVFGYANTELVGRRITRILPCGIERTDARDLVGLRCNGDRFPLTTSVADFDLNSGERRRVIIVRDVSLERDAEEELLRARERDHRLHFMANVTHELRTPLHGILGFAEVAERQLRKGVPERVERNLGRIRRSGSTLLALVDDILDLSKMLMAGPDMEFQSASLGRAVEEVVEGVSGLAEQSGIQIHLIGFDPPLPNIRMHTERIRQVLRNILANAIRFSPENENIYVEWAALSDGQRIVVRDNGCGIPEDEVETIFHPFTQSSRTKSGGTGLGLSISREIIEAHGGRIWAESAPSGGAQVSFVVPVAPPTNVLQENR